MALLADIFYYNTWGSGIRVKSRRKELSLAPSLLPAEIVELIGPLVARTERPRKMFSVTYFLGRSVLSTGGKSLLTAKEGV